MMARFSQNSSCDVKRTQSQSNPRNTARVKDGYDSSGLMCCSDPAGKHTASELIHTDKRVSYGLVSAGTDLYAGHDSAGHDRQLPGDRAHAALELHHVRHGRQNLTQAVRAAGRR